MYAYADILRVGSEVSNMWNAIAKTLLIVLDVLFAVSWWSTASKKTKLVSQILFTIASLACLCLAVYLVFKF